jgi:hypothetical protein
MSQQHVPGSDKVAELVRRRFGRCHGWRIFKVVGRIFCSESLCSCNRDRDNIDNLERSELNK